AARRAGPAEAVQSVREGRDAKGERAGCEERAGGEGGAGERGGGEGGGVGGVPLFPAQAHARVGSSAVAGLVRACIHGAAVASSGRLLAARCCKGPSGAGLPLRPLTRKTALLIHIRSM